MSNLPKEVLIQEKGPSEAFAAQTTAAADTVRLIEALGRAGVRHIQVCPFAGPRAKSGGADSDAVVASFRPKPWATYTATWSDMAGLERALRFGRKLSLSAAITLSAARAFTRAKLSRNHTEHLVRSRNYAVQQMQRGVPVTRAHITDAFGCDTQGDITPEQVIATVDDAMLVAAEAGGSVITICLTDPTGWATPVRVERAVGAVRDRWPGHIVSLQLHDTRGLAVANAHSALKMGVGRFGSAIGGIGQAPPAAGRSGDDSLCTEELVLLCEELGIRTGIDLDALIAVGRLAETILGRPLPSRLIRTRSLGALRRKAA